MTQSFDILIVGSGIVGLTLAAALASQTTCTIAILEREVTFPAWCSEKINPRVSAFSLSSKHILRELNCWHAIAHKRVSPFVGMEVWDAKSQGQINFTAADIAEDALGFIIENNLVQQVLLAHIRHVPSIHFVAPVKLTQVDVQKTHVDLTDEENNKWQAKLVIAADGADSWLRTAVGIGIKREPYFASAIVTTVQTALPHNQIARQLFLPDGPLAFLPLKNADFSSIVWSLPHSQAEALLRISENQFKEKLANAFQYRLGEIRQIGPRFAFPLIKQQAKHFVIPRVVLVGDAAHVVHPLAGQGINLGLLDAMALIEAIQTANHARRDFASFPYLRRYERACKAANQPMLTAIHLLQRLFASQNASLQKLRGVGLNITNQTTWIKSFLIRQATLA